jgi:hypothetical protein
MCKSLDPLYKGKVTLEVGRRIHAVEKWMEIWLNTCHKKRQTGGPLSPLCARIEETLWLARNVRSFPKLTTQTRSGPTSSCPISFAAMVATLLLMSPQLSSTRIKEELEGIYNFRLTRLESTHSCKHLSLYSGATPIGNAGRTPNKKTTRASTTKGKQRRMDPKDPTNPGSGPRDLNLCRVTFFLPSGIKQYRFAE